jgi:exosome complex RNA-binding protein Rrp4
MGNISRVKAKKISNSLYNMRTQNTKLPEVYHYKVIALGANGKIFLQRKKDKGSSISEL